MANERKTLDEFRVRRAANGGWTIWEGLGKDEFLPVMHAYSSDRDMLAALPGLIGAKEPEDMMEQFARMQQRTMSPDDAVEATKAEMEHQRRMSGVPNLGNAESPMIHPLIGGIRG